MTQVPALQSHCAPAEVPSAHVSTLRGKKPVQSLGLWQLFDALVLQQMAGR
jgi:hypothetical protein